MSHRGPLLLTAVLIAFVPWAGCFSPEGTKYHDPEFPPLRRGAGLGLEVPPTLPPPGPFLEGTAEASKVIDFFRDAPYYLILEDCPSEGRGNPAVAAVAAFNESQPLSGDAAPGAAYDACAQRAHQLAGSVINVRPASQTLEQFYNLLLVSTIRAVENEAALITEAMGRAGSVVDVEFVAGLMDRHVWHQIILRQGDDGYDAYNPEPDETGGPPRSTNAEETSRSDSRVSLEFAVALLLETGWETTVTPKLLDLYPWTEGSCIPPDWDALAVGILRERGRALESARAAPHGDDSYSDYELERLEHFLDDNLSRGRDFSFHVRRGWWPQLLLMASEVDHARRYWENYTTARLPTVAEGRYLFARHLNESRTLRTGLPLGTIESGFHDLVDGGYASADNQGWGLRPRLALQVILLRDTPWSFAELRCEPDA